MALVELQVGTDGKFLAKPTKMEQPASEYATRAAMFARVEKTKLEEQWDERRVKFFQWALENPTDLDMILDELDKYGVLFEWEYEYGSAQPVEAVEACGPLSRDGLDD